MIGYIYKLTCSKTKKVYYGSTIDYKKRQNRGWYKTRCKDFIKPTFEIIKQLEVENYKQLHLIENDYILNNDCVNNNVAIRTKETDKIYYKKYREENKEKIIESKKKYEKKINQVFIICDVCGKKLKKRSLRLHNLNFHQSILSAK